MEHLLLFICLFLHVGRGLYYGSYGSHRNLKLGNHSTIHHNSNSIHRLHTSTRSFWGATVIINLLSAIPYIGIALVEWIWGGFSVNKATLTQFFTFHILSFIILALVTVHLFFLHEIRSPHRHSIRHRHSFIPFLLYNQWHSRHLSYNFSTITTSSFIFTSSCGRSC